MIQLILSLVIGVSLGYILSAPFRNQTKKRIEEQEDCPMPVDEKIMPECCDGCAECNCNEEEK